MGPLRPFLTGLILGFGLAADSAAEVTATGAHGAQWVVIEVLSGPAAPQSPGSLSADPDAVFCLRGRRLASARKRHLTEAARDLSGPHPEAAGPASRPCFRRGDPWFSAASLLA